MSAQLKIDPRIQWLEDRRRGIGGSDVAPILGLSKWRTPLDVYRDKRGESDEQSDNEAMLWGRTLEPVIRQQYAERTGRVVRLPEGIMQHPEHDFMLANLDGVTDDGRVLEIKTARSGADWGEPGSAEIPDAYALQVQHYLCVTGLAVADVAVLIAGSDFRLYEVPADIELHRMLITAEGDFWAHVLAGRPPEPVSFADAVAAFGRSAAAGSVEASERAVMACHDLRRIRMEIKALEEDEAAQKAIVMLALGQAGDTLTHAGKALATWKLAKAPERFDTAAFRAAHADLAAAYTAPGTPSRRLLIKD